MEVASPGVGQRGHLINDDPQHLLLARGGVMVSAQVAIESPGVGTVCRDEGVDDLPFAGLDLESGPDVHDEVGSHGLEDGTLGPGLDRDDEVGLVTHESALTVSLTSRLLDRPHEPTNEPRGHVLQSGQGAA